MPERDSQTDVDSVPVPARARLLAGGGTIAQSPDQLEVLTEAAQQLPPSSFYRPTITVRGYEVERELGRGGMGVVYKAKHVALNRTVALKMVSGAADERAVIRFLAEAEAVAAIDHPNVVRVFDYGNAEGRPFMALEYVPGGTLKAALAAAGRQTPMDAAALLEKIARGVQAAHDLGIVHRDLKPANILLHVEGRSSAKGLKGDSRNGEACSVQLCDFTTMRLRDATPKVSDFGLAKRAASAELTGSWDLLGTPGYMSPEQAGGKTKFVGPASDVWALGIILYECLTGKRPFEGSSVDEVLIEILRTDAPTIRHHDTDIPRDLEMICQKCLAKDPAQRYATAGELADDLRRFQAGEPIAARGPSLRAVIATWAGQNFGSAGWAVPGGAAIGLAVGAFTLMDLLGTKLCKVGAVYDRLPSLPRPLFACGQVDRGLLSIAEAVMYLLLPGLVLLTTALVRPRNRSADVAAGLVTGLVAAFAFFAVGLGWCTVYIKVVRPSADDLNLLSGPEEKLTERYPDLTNVPLKERRQVVADKIFYDAAVRAPLGVLVGVVLSFAVAVPTCTALVCLAGGLLRQHQRFWQVVPLYLEVTLPAVIFVGYFYLVAQRWVLMRMPPQNPECYAALLILTGFAVWAATAKRSAPTRIAAQVAWFVFYAVTNRNVCYEF